MNDITSSFREEINAAKQHIEKASNTALALQEFTVNSLTKDADANITELGHCIGMVGSFVKASYSIFLQNLLGELSKCADNFDALKKKFQDHCVNTTTKFLLMLLLNYTLLE